MYSRRQFIKTTATAAIVAPLIVKSSVVSGMGHVVPSDKISLGFIGCGSMGTANLNECVGREDVVLTAAADVWKQR
ncbi:MAG: twin-arginine translocation signal domain-containing protein, partial [Prevotellaceae bacterium]|nr:twin-arginine translocation signal domain-containing protein [Prevotellaceae bacterium]